MHCTKDFAEKGYWFWLKSPKAHGFDLKAFDQEHVYMRSTELKWTHNTTFKRFVKDLPIAERCVPEGKLGETIKVTGERFDYYESCKSYKSSRLGTAVNTLDVPVMTDVGGNVGQHWMRVLHYRYNCDSNFANCQGPKDLSSVPIRVESHFETRQASPGCRLPLNDPLPRFVLALSNEARRPCVFVGRSLAKIPHESPEHSGDLPTSISRQSQ